MHLFTFPFRGDHCKPRSPMSLPQPTPTTSDTESRDFPDPHLPPSPPSSPPDRSGAAVDQYVDTLRRRPRAGCATRVTLTPGEWKEVKARLDSAWFDENKYDYEPGEQALLLRMPRPSHERLIAALRTAVWAEIERWRDSLQLPAPIRRALAIVRDGGSTTQLFPIPEGDAEQTPDMSVYHRMDDTYPTLVAEVAHSQRTASVQRKCKSYVKRSQGAVQCALALDLPYNGQPEAPTITIFRPHLTPREPPQPPLASVQSVVIPFRHPDGSACDGSLDLTLADILCLNDLGGSDALRDMCRSTPLAIPLATLANALTEVEEATRNPRKRVRSEFEAAEWSQSPSPTPSDNTGAETEKSRPRLSKRQQVGQGVREGDTGKERSVPHRPENYTDTRRRSKRISNINADLAGTQEEECTSARRTITRANSTRRTRSLDCRSGIR